ncbi:MAG: hypothetical protein ABL307_16420 [Roseitalea porphyridii]|uniref:hypothetical protein n=1 Tax=Roseitalea porphyridii TaxID=1852022 RepID=UPI0032D8F652
MISLDYAFHHLESVFGIIVGRPGALDRMDISAEGFWRSFSAIVVALPALFFIWVITATTNVAAAPGSNLGALVATEAILALVGWLLPVAVFAIILKPLGLSHRFAHLVIVRNWANAFFSYMMAALFVPYLGLPQGHAVLGFLGIVLLVVVLVAAVRLMRAALDCSPPTAIAFVAGELLISVGLAVYVAPSAGVSG